MRPGDPDQKLGLGCLLALLRASGCNRRLDSRRGRHGGGGPRVRRRLRRRQRLKTRADPRLQGTPRRIISALGRPGSTSRTKTRSAPGQARARRPDSPASPPWALALVNAKKSQGDLAAVADDLDVSVRRSRAAACRCSHDPICGRANCGPSAQLAWPRPQRVKRFGHARDRSSLAQLEKCLGGRGSRPGPQRARPLPSVATGARSGLLTSAASASGEPRGGAGPGGGDASRSSNSIAAPRPRFLSSFVGMARATTDWA